MEFLEKEIKVQQQMTVIQTNLNMGNPGGGKDKDKDGKHKDKDGRIKSGKGSPYYGQQPNNKTPPSQNPTCVICGANDHV